jgi:UMF1 family MFS transporter
MLVDWPVPECIFTGENVSFGILMAIIASIGYSGSLVFYEAYLPEIATPDRFDKLSARGYAMGYLGSVILLVINLVMIEQPALFGLPDGSIPARISFVTVGDLVDWVCPDTISEITRKSISA